MAGQDPVDLFIEQIVDQKNLAGVTPEIKQQVVTELKGRLMDQIDRAMIDSLNNEQLDKFNTLLDSQNTTDQQLQDFFATSGIDSQQVVLDTMLKFREFYLGAA